MNELALFAGAGGGILGGHLLGWRTVCAVEWEPYPASVLCARQNDGLLPPFPIWDDVQTFDGRPWRGIVDVVSGGFPCQDISAAGKGDGLDGERSGMWKHMARVVGEVRPRFVFVENSPMLTTRGGTRVIGDLTALGYDCRWTVMGAADVGANHQRNRMWIVGKSQCAGLERQWSQPGQQEIAQFRNASSLAHSVCGRLSITQHESIKKRSKNRTSEWTRLASKSWWQIEPNVGRVVDGLAARVDRLKAIGNGQVPLCAATAWRVLSAP
jgi:DNA (cytosine-5)-methyltransferase 1